MPSASTDLPALWRAACLLVVVAACLPAHPVAAEEGQAAGDVAVVGLVRSSDPEVTEALARGLRMALAGPGGPALRLKIAGPTDRWRGAARATASLVTAQGAVALVSPPERAVAHVMAQVATKRRLPLVTTSPAASVTGAGSFFVCSVVPVGPAPRAADLPVPAPSFDAAAPAAAGFVRRFRDLHGRDPGAWEAAGFDAGQVLVAVRQRSPVGHRPFDSLRDGPAVEGATGRIRLDGHGRRLTGSDILRSRALAKHGARALSHRTLRDRLRNAR